MFMSALFVSVFSTTVWLVYALHYLSAQLGENALSSLSLTEFGAYSTLVFAPVFVIWQAYGLIMRSVHEKENAEQTLRLLKEVRKNIEYTDLTMRLMIDAEHEIKDGFMVQKFDVFIADLNELLAEIVQRSNAASSLETEQLWRRVKNGERWVIGKALLEAAQNADDFGRYLAEKTAKDSIFKGTLREFCNRYQNLVTLLEKHDQERVFIHILETGVMGRVYSILAPIAETGENAPNESTPAVQKIKFDATPNAPAPEIKPTQTDEEEIFFSKLREKMEAPLETSPTQDMPETSYESRLDASLTEDLEKPRADKEFAYPFGGWMNDNES